MRKKFEPDAEFIAASANLVNGNEKLIRALVPVFEQNITEFDSEGVDGFDNVEWNYLFVVFLMGLAVGARNDSVIEALKENNWDDTDDGNGGYHQ